MFKHLIRRYLSLALVLALVLAASVETVQTAVASGENGIERAIAAQEAHNGALFGISGVVGTGVGLGDDGNPVVVVFTETAGVPGIPEKLDGVPVVARVTGKFVALHHKFGHCDGPPGAPLGPECEGGDPTPGITVTPISGLVTTEGGGTDTFTVVLDTEPTDDVTIGLSSSDTSEGTADALSLTFTTANWDSPQTVTITGVDDDEVDGDIDYEIVTAPAEGAAEYIDLDAADVAVTNTDDDGGITFPRPANIGTSSGSDRLIVRDGQLFCIVGTLGFRATVAGATVAVSNAHIYALEGSTPDDDPDATGRSTDRILQPARVDLPSGCGTAEERDAAVIGTLADWVPIILDNALTCVFDGERSGCNTVDAAIAATTASDVGVSTPEEEDGYGTPSGTTVAAALELAVQKYGRTTALTVGHVSEINVFVGINYDNGIAYFENQIAFHDDRRGMRDTFSAGGDSGSLIVTIDGNNPVALLFAGSLTRTLGNPIDAVLDAFGATIDVTP